MFKKLLHGKRKSALLNLTWSGLLCRVVWSVSQLLYLLQRAGHFKFFSPSFFVGLELTIEHCNAEYIGALLLSDPVFCREIWTILIQNCGKTIREIGGIELSYTL